MEKILLALLVALAGSFILPATRLGRVFVSMPVRQQSPETIGEVKVQIDHVPLAPAAGAGGFEFHPLTQEEKKNSKIR